MTRRWPRRLSQTMGLRLTAWYAGIFLVSVAAVGALAYWLLVTSLERRDRDLLQLKLGEYAAQYRTGGLPAVARAVSIEQASGGPDVVLVRLVGTDADVRLFSVPPAWRAFDLAQLESVRTSSGETWMLVPSVTREATLEVLSRPLGDGAVMQVGRSTVGRDQFLSQVRSLLGIIVAAVIVAGLAGGAALTRSALRPLRDLRNTVRGIARTGQLSARVGTDAHDDLVSELGRVFNAMIGRIETLVEGMRGALDTVAHDLRTPVARLRARAESALAESADAETCREVLAECVEEADHVMALLTTLMDVSEAETGTMHLDLTAVPVAEVAQDTIDLYEDTAEDRGVRLVVDLPAGLVVRADRQRVRQVLANLVDNALKHTPGGGTVTIAARPDGPNVALTVADTGSGIGPDDLPRIWDRLYRGESPQDQRGLGLGLSLVRAIIKAHGGEATVESEVGRGSTFRITLPSIPV